MFSILTTLIVKKNENLTLLIIDNNHIRYFVYFAGNTCTIVVQITVFKFNSAIFKKNKHLLVFLILFFSLKYIMHGRGFVFDIFLIYTQSQELNFLAKNFSEIFSFLYFVTYWPLCHKIPAHYTELWMFSRSLHKNVVMF